MGEETCKDDKKENEKTFKGFGPISKRCLDETIFFGETPRISPKTFMENTYFPKKTQLETEELTSSTYKREIIDGLATFLGEQVYMNEYTALEDINIPMPNWTRYTKEEPALERLAQARIREKHVTGIRINTYKTDTLIKRINQLTELEELKLNNNALEKLPEETTQLGMLETLIVYNNGLTRLPTKINELTNLKILKLDNNVLTHAPITICWLEHLEELSISLNQLTTLPSSIGKLTHLKKLNLSYNKIKTLPDELAELKNLEEINLNGNRIETIPDCLLKMHAKIYIDYNLLTPYSKSVIEKR